MRVTNLPDNIELAPIAGPPTEGSGLRLPTERLDAQALNVMRAGHALSMVIMPPLVALVLYGLHRWLGFHGGWVIGVPLALFLLEGISLVVLPQIDVRNWYYEIREDEVDTLHGIWIKERRIVPMSRIQHVNVNQGPVQRRYGLATVEYFTAAGRSEIPQLAIERAAEVRDQIAALAKVHDEL